eukprot:m.134414 g.134414  ORF g.134414 m.134414 type:complete len:149 (-) comp14693_c0_seq11:1470-1916(-)
MFQLSKIQSLQIRLSIMTLAATAATVAWIRAEFRAHRRRCFVTCMHVRVRSEKTVAFAEWVRNHYVNVAKSLGAISCRLIGPITDGDDRNTQSFHVHYEYASQAKYDQANRNAKQVNAMGSTLGLAKFEGVVEVNQGVTGLSEDIPYP